MQELVQMPLVRVVKLGGSLFELSDLRQRFHTWLSAQPPAVNLVIAGGGELVEAVRRIDGVHSLNAALAHWMCVDLMGISAKMVSEILQVQTLIAEPTEFAKFLELHRSNVKLAASGVAILHPTAYYARQSAVATDTLPESWSCTSDSIAAWLANHIKATELVLLKSTACDTAPWIIGASSLVTPEQLQELSQRGVVDDDFPHFARNLTTIRLVNLRDPSFCS